MSEFIHYEVVNLFGMPVANFWAPAFHKALSEGRSCHIRSELVRSRRDLARLEDAIKSHTEVVGWVTWVGHKYPLVKGIVLKLGGVPFFVLDDRTWYLKKLKEV